MAKGAGRKCLIKKAGTTIAGVRVTGIKADMTPIDVTDNDSVGIQELLAGIEASRALTLTVSGVESDHVLRDAALNAAEGSCYFTDLTFVFGNALVANDVLACNWFMSGYQEDMDYKGAITFSATFMSSGTWTRT